MLHDVFPVSDPNLLAGMGEDAGIYKLREDLAIVVTLDYFNPIVKDAYVYGQIAAANALSDVYAMGGKPVIAANIVCFPASVMPLHMLREVLRGSSQKLQEAGVVLVGGHTVMDPKEIKYGLTVIGTIDPRRILTKGEYRVGDKLILTKALGTGIINNALQGKLVDDGTQAEVAQSMATLNKTAAEVALSAEVHACTDVTGFGLAGHLYEMVEAGKDTGLKVYAATLPLFSRVEEFAKAGLIPPGTRRNRKCRGVNVEFSKEVPEWLRWVVFDAQTSGGLVLAVAPEGADAMIERLHEEGVSRAAIIGEVVGEPAGGIVVE